MARSKSSSSSSDSSSNSSSSESYEEIPQLASRRRKRNRRRGWGLPRNSQQVVYAANPDDYEQKYPEDDYGFEMSPNARVWRMYLDEAQSFDSDMIDGWKDSIDVLLVFAGLFSAVVTTFVVETSKKFELDYNEVNTSLLMEMVALQRAMAQGTGIESVIASPLNSSSKAIYTSIDTWVNGLWFTSLAFSIATALAATVMKQWLQYYVSLMSGAPQQRVRIRQFRYLGLQRWAVPTIIGLIPVFLHISVFLFFCGLFVFLIQLKPQIGYIVASIGAAIYTAYIVTTILPFIYPQCPYKTPLSAYLYRATLYGRISLHFVFNKLIRLRWLTPGPLRQLILAFRPARVYPSDWVWPQTSEARNAERAADEMEAEALLWLSSSSNPVVQNIVAQSLSGLASNFSHLHLLTKHHTFMGQLSQTFESCFKAINTDSGGIPFLLELDESTMSITAAERLFRACFRIISVSPFPVEWNWSTIVKLKISKLADNEGTLNGDRWVAIAHSLALILEAMQFAQQEPTQSQSNVPAVTTHVSAYLSPTLPARAIDFLTRHYQSGIELTASTWMCLFRAAERGYSMYTNRNRLDEWIRVLPFLAVLPAPWDDHENHTRPTMLSEPNFDVSHSIVKLAVTALEIDTAIPMVYQRYDYVKYCHRSIHVWLVSLTLLPSFPSKLDVDRTLYLASSRLLGWVMYAKDKPWYTPQLAKHISDALSVFIFSDFFLSSQWDSRTSGWMFTLFFHLFPTRIDILATGPIRYNLVPGILESISGFKLDSFVASPDWTTSEPENVNLRPVSVILSNWLSRDDQGVLKAMLGLEWLELLEKVDDTSKEDVDEKAVIKYGVEGV